VPRPDPAAGHLMRTDVPEGFRSGFACFVGRPNAGKSTLTNALVGSKIAIASSKPQTTRHAIRGIVHREDAQLVLIDTPGLHKPRTLLGERLNDLVRGTWTEVDVIGVCLPASQRIGPGDTYLVGEIAALPRKPKLVAVATKSDLVSGQRMAEHLMSIAALEERLGIRWEHIVPVSAVAGDQLDVLADSLVSLLPEGPPLYPDGDITDEPEETLVAELIREVALEGVRDELPHSITVVVEEMNLREDRPADKPLLDVFASMIVERDSQKGIIIGHKGSRLRDIGAAARQQIEALLGTPVYLDLRVKVLREWQRDAKHLNRLGF
jgi:GTP-binding protein Era